MKLPLLIGLVLTPAAAFAQNAALPQIRSADGSVVLRAQPTQTVDDAGRPIDPRAPQTSTSVSTAIVLGAPEAFQQILPASTTRLGCLIQNKSAGSIVRIFLGAAGSATPARSTDIDPGETFSCASTSGLVLTDAIAAAGTVAATPILVVTQ